MSTVITAAACTNCSQTLKKEWNLKFDASLNTETSIKITERYHQASESSDQVTWLCQACWIKAVFPFLGGIISSREAPTIQLEVEMKPNFEQYRQDQIEELESLVKKVTGLSQELDVLKQNAEILNNQINSLRTESTSLKEETYQTELLCAEMKHKMNILENERKELEEYLSNLNAKKEQVEEEKSAVARERKRLDIDENKQILKYKEKRVKETDFKDFYDCRIMADSFYTLLKNDSWGVEYKDFQEYLHLRAQNTTKVAVLGYENTGKSFLLSKLTGSELPQGSFMKTTGICLKYPREKYLPWTALDTPGTNISIKAQQMNENLSQYFEEKGLSDAERMRMLLGDNILMENLLQEFIVKHAQVLLVVTGKLHRDDQKLVNRIKMLSGKRVIVVHNLLDARQKEDVEEMIKEDIFETFSVTTKPIYLERIEAGKGEGMNQVVYLENEERNDKAIEHVVMAHEGSPAGDYYNESAITYIKTLITSMPFVKPFDLVEAFQIHFNDRLKNYLHSKSITKGDPLILERDENGVPKTFRLNDHLKYDLKLSSADEFGQIRTFDREGLEYIPHTVKIDVEETDAGVQKILRVELEIVGEYEEQNIRYKIHPLPNSQVRIEIRGKSSDNTMRRAKCDILENTRKFGDFNIITEPINLDGLVINTIERCNRNNTEVPGLMILAWNLYKPVDDAW